MKSKLNKLCPFWVVLLFLFTAPVLSLEWGEKFHYASPGAPPVKHATPLKRTIASPKQIGKINGIVFEQAAKPEGGFIVESLYLRYDPLKKDGKRLLLTINGTNLSTALYDWILVPLAKFSDTGDVTVLTTLGKLNDKDLQKRIIKNKGMVINYHPEFENTLLGLRLLHFYTLILSNHSVDLPTKGERYILEGGENAPDVEQNKKAFAFFAERMKKLFKAYPDTFTSFIITDQNRNISFSVKGAALQFSGSPSFYFWGYQSQKADFDPEFMKRSFTEKLNQEKERNLLFNERAWIMNSLLKSIRNYRQGYSLVLEDPLKKACSISSEKELREFLNPFQANQLFDLLVALETRKYAKNIRHLELYSRGLSESPDMIKGIHPMIWEEGIEAMRYAAFFRYCRENHGEAWKSFMDSIKQVNIPFVVKTPTVMYPSTDKALEKILKKNPGSKNEY